jgi:uncharacterized Zn finger protein
MSSVEVFISATLKCRKCGLVHSMEKRKSLAQELFKVQFEKLREANERGVEVGEVKCPEVGEWVAVLEGVVEWFRMCPPEREG